MFVRQSLKSKVRVVAPFLQTMTNSSFPFLLIQIEPSAGFKWRATLPLLLTVYFESGGTSIPSCYCCLERPLHALRLFSCQVRSVLRIDPLWYGKTWKKRPAPCDMACVSPLRLWMREGEAPGVCLLRILTGQLCAFPQFSCGLGKCCQQVAPELSFRCMNSRSLPGHAFYLCPASMHRNIRN